MKTESQFSVSLFYEDRERILSQSILWRHRAYIQPIYFMKTESVFPVSLFYEDRERILSQSILLRKRVYFQSVYFMKTLCGPSRTLGTSPTNMTLFIAAEGAGDEVLHLLYTRVGHPFFYILYKKNAAFFALFYFLYKRRLRSLRSFTFFIKELKRTLRSF